MKPRLLKAIVSALGGVALGVSYYLHSVDHPTWVPVPGFQCVGITFGCNPLDGRYEVPPPWYASLWPEALVLGLAFLFLPWVREIPHAARVAFRAVKVAYRKWDEWDRGGRTYP